MDLDTIIKKAHNEWKENPTNAKEEIEVVSKYSNIFSPKNIDNITREDFSSFLNFRNNKHWRGLERQGPEITEDMQKFKKTLKLLLDEAIPIDQRIRRIRDKNSPEYHKGFGSAYYTPILLVVYPTKYPVVNKIVKYAIQRIGLYPDYDSKPEWIAYPEIIPKILELAVRNNISLWQMDWAWYNLYTTFDYEGLNNFIKNIMDSKTTYQPIMIKTLLQNGPTSKLDLDMVIRKENPNKGNDFVSHEVYEVLVDKHKVVKLEAGKFELNLSQPLTSNEKHSLIALCDQEISRIREIQELSGKKVSELHLAILKKFHKKSGKYLKAEEIYGMKKDTDIKKTPLPPDEDVQEPHYMHNLITGVFWLSGDDYALSIQLNPKSKWELEIDRDHPTLRIVYDFGNNPVYKSQINKLKNCYENDVPIGLIFKTLKAKNKILGLGKIVSFNDTKFIIDSYGISEQQSRFLKEETIREFDKSLADPEFEKIEDVNYPALFADINLSDGIFIQKSSNKPDTQSAAINQIIDNCESGNWVIPRFQRYFNWRKEDIRDFLKSIFLGYYVGSLLLWNVKGKRDLDIMPIDGVTRKQNFNQNEIILDGQQRISSLYYAIKAPAFELLGDKKGRFSFFYIDFAEFFTSDEPEDLIKVFSEKISAEESFKKMLFPVYQLENYDTWIDDLEEFLLTDKNIDQEKIRDIRKLIRKKLRDFYDGFEIPFVILGADRSLEQVTEIFEKINSSGIQLNVFDLLIARLNKYDINLRDLWNESLRNPKISEYEGKKSAYKIPIYILQSIALCFSKSRSCKRRDILNIYSNVAKDKSDFQEKWRIMTKYTLDAISQLENTKDGFGVITPDAVPFEVMIPVLASLLREIETNFRDYQKKSFDKLENWYWTSVFSIAYSSAVDSKKTSDFKEMMDWLSHDDIIPKSIKKFRSEYNLLLDLKSVEQQTNAIYRGVLCLIALRGGYDFDKNRSIGNKKYQKDYIFPKSSFINYENVNSILNMTWLTPDTNQRIKKARKPSTFMTETIHDKYDSDEKEFLKTLDSHFINHEAYQCMKENDFEKFIEKRDAAILEAIGEKIGAGIDTVLPSMTTPYTPHTNIRIIQNAIEKCKGYVYWVDKYFARSDLDILSDASKKGEFNHVKILISLKNADQKMRDYFIRFREEMKNNNTTSEMRVVVDSKVYSEYHDRWLLSSNINYNLMSGDVAKRGQYAEIKTTQNRPPFIEWWNKSLDIISDWNDISKKRDSMK